MKSAVIYGIGALREQLSELGEASEKWVNVRRGLEGGHHGQQEGAQTLAPLPHGPGGETEVHGGQVTCPRPLSRGIPQCQELLLCHLQPGRGVPQAVWSTHFVLLLFASREASSCNGSRKQKPEPLCGAGKSFRLQGSRGRPLRGGDIYAKH